MLGSGFQLVVAPWPTALEKGCFALSDFIHSWKWEYLDRVWSNFLLYLDEVCEGSPDWHARLFNFL